MSQSFKSEVLAQLQTMNSDTTQPHSFDLYLYLPSESLAKQAADKVGERGFLTTVLSSASGKSWLCRATIKLVPDIAPFDEIHGFLQLVATTLHGEFDGWESDIINKMA